ncbi:FtsB family cell division protein [Anaerosinus gibii]|uniref:Septum formation initiator family protein n=1 Tax=Selenobaculum gibii TaxID=3054208 RepID=A0A9Y2AK17_9FIRM|nr:septum formation initiator family protein [Selenobaculum gbiensis]WIW71347.1 septum formation initiator family protein [Selenobaculum gbiensis]
MRVKPKVTWFRLVLVGIIVYFGSILVNQQSHLNEISKEQSLADTKLQQVTDLHKSLEEEKHNLNDLAYIEKIAREELGLVKKGEMPFILSNKS